MEEVCRSAVGVVERWRVGERVVEEWWRSGEGHGCWRRGEAGYNLGNSVFKKRF